METDVTKPRAVVERTLDAMARVDIQGVVSNLSDDVVWEVMGASYMPAGCRFEGKEAVQRDFLIGIVATVFDATAPFNLDVQGIHGDGPTVAVEWVLRARTNKGRSYENTYCLIFTVANGRIRSVREYTNTEYQKRVLFE